MNQRETATVAAMLTGSPLHINTNADKRAVLNVLDGLDTQCVLSQVRDGDKLLRMYRHKSLSSNPVYFNLPKDTGINVERVEDIREYVLAVRVR